MRCWNDFFISENESVQDKWFQQQYCTGAPDLHKKRLSVQGTKQPRSAGLGWEGFPTWQWKHFSCLNGERGSFWHLLGRCLRCCWKFCNAQNTPTSLPEQGTICSKILAMSKLRTPRLDSSGRCPRSRTLSICLAVNREVCPLFLTRNLAGSCC